MKKRMLWFYIAVLFAFSGLMVRLLQLAEDERLRAAGQQSSITVTVARARGTIYDRSLNRLTNRGSRYRAGVLSTPEAMAALSEALPEEEWKILYEQLQNGKPAVAVSETPLPLAAGITQVVAPVRYEEHQLAAHVIGYVGDDGTHGVSGVEQAADTLLSDGGKVTVTYQTDGRGNALLGGTITVNNTLFQAEAGVALTLDARLQNMVEVRGGELLDKGAIVVLDPQTGHILAMASFPTFEPVRLADYLEAENAPLFNRAMAAYNCGSVFKIASAATALEVGVPLTQTFYCSGSIPVGANVIKCHQLFGHSRQDMQQGFINSCNPYFIQLMQLVGGTPLYRMATAMSFNSALKLMDNYSTAPAVFPSESELLQPTALANVSFGQGALVATPVHIAQMTAAVANGGTVRPTRLLMGTVDRYGNLDVAKEEPPITLFSPSTAEKLRSMMIRVVEEGTGVNARPQTGGAGGKTGTAETGWLLENGSTMVQSWFTGFYPADSPRYVITVLSEDVRTTKKQSAPVFQKICDELANY